MGETSPRILFVDIETAPAIIAAWQLHDTNAIWVERDSHLLSFAWKWSDTKVQTRALPDYPKYKTEPYNDFGLAKELHELLDEADFVCAHNGARFDVPKINARLLVHGFKPPSPYKVIDTLRLTKKHFRFDSHKLDSLGGYAGIGHKVEHQGAKLWRRCLAGDPKAWATMRKYNARDVTLLEGWFKTIRPWGGVPAPGSGVTSSYFAKAIG